ncbi:MAG TPA: AsmA-like C-terminal region-containing protein [Puia sp.]|nr:AsmA-like C-terminal region-containing protein [Puia sp.]
MKKIARYFIRITGTILCLFLLLWLGLAGYVQVNKTALLQRVKTELSSRLAGEVRIGGADISFFRHWPSIAVRLSAVSLRDSGWRVHHHDLLNAAEVSITCNPLSSLLAMRITAGSVVIEHGQIYLFTDSAGYSNTYLLNLRGQKMRGRGSASGPGHPGRRTAGSIPEISLEDVRLVMDRQDKHKFFDLHVRRLQCAIEEAGRSLRLDIRAGGIHVSSWAFNTDKGSFLTDRTLSGRFMLEYNLASKVLQFHDDRIDIDGHPFLLSGRLFPTVVPDPLFLTLETDHILFRQATALLTPQLRQKLDRYDIDKPIAVKVQVDAGAADDSMPQVRVRLTLSDAAVLTPVGRFTGVSFTGSFINEWTHGHPRGDENSGIRLEAFTGRLMDIPLRSDSILITNLRHPQLACDLHSQTGLERLNDLTGSQTLRFTGGSGDLNIVYKGPLSENDTSGTVINGSVDIDSAGLLYLPYSFRLSGGKGRLLFKDQDLVIGRLDIRAGATNIGVRGIARNLIALIDQNSEDVSMDWQLTTPHLELADLLPLAGRTNPVTSAKQKSERLFGPAFSRIDRLLKEGAIHVSIDAADLRFRKFSGAHARADLVFNDHSIRLNRLNIEQGTGSIDLKAYLSRQAPGETSPLRIESHLERVDLPRIFAAFNDFGQDALTSANLKGRLTADIRMEGRLTGKAMIVPGSLKATVGFRITDGQLIDFAPMEKINVSFLKDRDLSVIRFSGLKNQLDVDSTTVTIHRMEINSSAFTLFVEGRYDLKTGPDMSLQIPLRNLSDSHYGDLPPDSRGNEGKAGPSIRLRARRGDDGKLKITWDPFRKALKKIRRASSATNR